MTRYLLAFMSLALMLAGSPTVSAQGTTVSDLFVTADRCMACHNGILTPTGMDASMGVDWRASMMANAARDPYWHAAVRREVLEHPMAQAAIENECSACHMPMTRFAAKATGEKGGVFAHLPITHGQRPEDLAAADGVSCALCHQIRNEQLGEDASFTAGFVIDTSTELGQRQIYGPFEVDAGRQKLMQSASFFLPEQGAHLQSSEHCATCHTLFTHSLNDQGEVVGEFPEQVPYLEWRHSAFRDVKSCQSCHMPVVDGEMPVTGVLGVPRPEVSRHVFRGGNFFMPMIFNRHRTELGVQALPQELANTSERTAKHLETAAARLSIEQVEIEGGRLTADVVVKNLAGHKLPSAYPSRRVWLHLAVRDADGALLFESGRLNPDGSIAGNDNDADPGSFEPHYENIRDPDQVQIYEAIMAEPDGAITTVLLSAVRYAKDNRILPDGFVKATAEDAVAVRGKALSDEDFSGGSDRLRYTADVAAGAGPLTVEAELFYQPIAYRWAHNLGQQKAPEIERFVGYYNEMAGSSAVMLAREVRTTR